MPAEMIDGKPEVFKSVTLNVVKMGVGYKDGSHRVDTLGELVLNERKFIMTAQEMMELAHLLLGCADAVARGGIEKGVD